MSSEARTASRKTTAVTVTVCASLFVLVVLYVGLVVDPRLINHQQGPVFLTTFAFLKTTLLRPGGAAEVVSLFLTQFHRFAWVGAVVIALSVLAVCASTRLLLKRFSGRNVHPAITCLPAVLLLILHGRYDYALTHTIGLILALLSAWLTMRLPVRGFVWRLAVSAALSLLVFATAGGMVLLFGVLSGAYEIMRRRRIVLGLLCIAFAAALPWASAYSSWALTPGHTHAPLIPEPDRLFSRTAIALTLPPRDIPETWLTTRLKLHLALALLFPVLLFVPARRRRRNAPGEDEAPAVGIRRGDVLVNAGLLVVAAAVIFWSFDRVAARRLRIDYYAQHRQWEQVLAEADKLPAEEYDAFVIHNVNRALFFSGALLERMFSYPQMLFINEKNRQTQDALLLLGPRVSRLWHTSLKSSALMFDLGQVNFAERSTRSALETYGERPDVLKRLVLLSMAKGRTRVARGFLNRLKRNPLHRRWAQERLERLDDGTLSDDDEILRLRAQMPRIDHGWKGIQGVSTYDDMLGQLVEADSNNHMAMAYLTAHHLLTKQWDLVAADVERLQKAGTAEVPQCCREAMFLAQMRKGGKLTSDSRTAQSFVAFEQDRKRWENAWGEEKEKLFNGIQAKHGRTYFFYARFGYSRVRPRPALVDAVSRATK